MWESPTHRTRWRPVSHPAREVAPRGAHEPGPGLEQGLEEHECQEHETGYARDAAQASHRAAPAMRPLDLANTQLPFSAVLEVEDAPR